MKNQFWKSMALSLALFFSFYCYSNPAVSQDIQTTPNLIQPQGWQGCLDPATVGGPCPVQRAGDGAILWSWGAYTLTQTFAVNQALSGTGIQIRGYNYRWDIKNANAGGNQSQYHDPLTITTRLYDYTDLNIIEAKKYNYSYRINDWTTFTGTEEFKNRYSLASLGNFQISISSRDTGMSSGYYGPEIKNISISMRYSINVCSTDPLLSLECPSYAEEYRQQQCGINPLFDSSCPGYTETHFQLQCSSNPLYNAACPGYQQAYFTQQCSANVLFSVDCPGYQQAYFNQQCTANPLYNNQCPGYQQAYFSQQCSLNPSFSTQCPTYQQAYFTQQCQLNSLYDSQCPGYSVAYQEKLQNDACKANSQSSPICPGYTAPTAGFSVTTVASAPVISTLVDPVTTVIEVPMVDDPIVNQTLSNNNTISLPDITKENTAIASPALGTGLRIPGLFVQSQTTTTTARQQALTNARIAARSTDNQVLNQIRDRQTQQQADTISAMSTVPGFDSYLNTEISDAQFYQPRDIYRGVNIPDNTRAKRALNQRSDRLHQEIINEQYRR